jgi:CRISPR-associated protein Cas1
MILLPLADRHETVWRIQHQTATTKPTRKNLWRQIIRAKIQGQRANLDPRSPAFFKLSELRDAVRSGDASNIESQAARVYWSHWLGPEHSFVRSGGTGELATPPNNLLDYGYAVVRAALARAIVSAGLVPAIGIHHSNRSNSYCLADDLIEPIRPMVDRRVRTLYRDGLITLSREAKESLLSLLTTRVAMPSEDSPSKFKTGPLGVSLHRYVSSFVECLPDMKQRRRLAIPRFCRKERNDC